LCLLSLLSLAITSSTIGFGKNTTGDNGSVEYHVNSIKEI